jgi:hypothetical protein
MGIKERELGIHLDCSMTRMKDTNFSISPRNVALSELANTNERSYMGTTCTRFGIGHITCDRC